MTFSTQISRIPFLLAAALAATALAIPIALAADQPVAGEATLVGGQALPTYGALPAHTEGGFSGLFPVANQPGQFWTISDRGPNGDTFSAEGATRRPFFAPAFTPSIYKVAVAKLVEEVNQYAAVM